MTKNYNGIKMLLTFFIYFIITMYGGGIIKTLGFNSNILNMFIRDLLFLIIIIYLYIENIKEDYKYLVKNYTLIRIIKNTLFWTIIIILFKIIFGFLYDTAIGIDVNDLNVNALTELYSTSIIYIVFKGFIFGVIAEQLLFREAIRTCINNKWLFIFVSAGVFTIMNFIFVSNFSNINLEMVLYYSIAYFIPSLILGIVYIQNKSNILLLMLISFTYNIIPLYALIAGK